MTSLVTSTGTILDRIVAQTAVDVEDRRRRVPVEKLRNMAETRRDPIDVRASLLRDDVAVIPEFKRASPSKGRFPVEMEPADVAGAYVGGGAAMIS
ncbi:MAG TPA: indole-3-glycerol-phosphate synthase TrpC, partial [Thermomicrobiales bacterium]|nr:indole-3-glycerol-phosphate synthase TrpC [Thermomicrobiales bacterium]